MIEAHNYEPIAKDIEELPWSTQMLNVMDRIANYSERQREAKAPECLTFVSTITQLTTHVRYRVKCVTISAGAVSGLGDIIRIQVGTRNYDFYASLGTDTFEFPIEIDRGVNLTVTNLTVASTDYVVQIFAYPE